MKNLIIALMCIFTLSIGMTANASPIDTSPDIECAIFAPDISADIANDFTSVADHPCFEPSNVTCTSTSIEGVSFCIVLLPDCLEDPDNPNGAINDNLNATPTLATTTALETDETTDDPCVTNTETTTALFAPANRGYKNKKRKAKRRNGRSKNKSIFPGSKAPKKECAWSN